jgi:hypothetical protein
MSDLYDQRDDVLEYLQSRRIPHEDHSRRLRGAIWTPESGLDVAARRYLALEFGAHFRLAGPGKGPFQSGGWWWRPKVAESRAA